jgi:formylmethanofuran dehydrogenase subunit E
MTKPILIIRCKRCGKPIASEPNREQEGRVITLVRTCSFCHTKHHFIFGASPSQIKH